MLGHRQGLFLLRLPVKGRWSSWQLRLSAEQISMSEEMDQITDVPQDSSAEYQQHSSRTTFQCSYTWVM